MGIFEKVGVQKSVAVIHGIRSGSVLQIPCASYKRRAKNLIGRMSDGLTFSFCCNYCQIIRNQMPMFEL